MNNNFYFILFILLIAFNSCSNPYLDKFTYEEFNGEKHIEVTKKNMIQLIEMSDDDLEELLIELNYKKNEEGQSDFSYIQKTDTVSGVFQTIEVRYSPDRVVDVIWVSLDEKDRFEKFINDTKNPQDIYISKENAYMLMQDNKDYLAVISDLVVAKRISITKMDGI